MDGGERAPGPQITEYVLIFHDSWNTAAGQTVLDYYTMVTQ